MQFSLFFGLFLCFIASVGAMTLFVLLNHEEVMQHLVGTSYGNAFVEFDEIIDAVICTVSVTGVIAVELILDIAFDNKLVQIRDQEERAMLLLVTIIPGFFILVNSSEHYLPFVYACVHSIQILGIFVPINLLCAKLVPVFFPRTKLLASFFFMCVAMVLLFINIGFNYTILTLTVMLFACISFFVLGKMVLSWGKDLVKRIQGRHLFGNKFEWKSFIAKLFEVMTEDEIACFVYLFVAMVFVFILPALTMATHRLSWTGVTTVDVCVNIYSFAIFSVLCGVIPGRVRQHAAIKANKATIRYISHEIRSPLNIVHNGVRVVIDSLKNKNFGSAAEDKVEIVDDLEDIYHASTAAVNIVDDLLNFERIGSRTFAVDKSLQPALPAFTEMASRCQVYAQKKGINCTVLNEIHQDPGHVYYVNIDSFKVEQVFRNLIVNAVKFTPEHGSITVKIRHENEPTLHTPHTSQKCRVPWVVWFCHSQLFGWLSLICSVLRGCACFSTSKVLSIAVAPALESNASVPETKKPFGKICVEISDTGVGMSCSEFNSVFGQFVQFNPNTLQGGGGSGLGLWICKEIILQHGGTITVKSPGLNLGTVFTVKLDCFFSTKRDLRDRMPSHAAVNDKNGCTNPAWRSQVCALRPDLEPSKHNAARILIVDDSEVNRKMTKKMIIQISKRQNGAGASNLYNFIFFEANDGLKAVELVQSAASQFNLVLIDNIMIHMNGPEAVKKMREEGCSALIIGVTGNVNDADIIDFKNHGADDVLKKPVSLEKLASIVSNLVVG